MYTQTLAILKHRICFSDFGCAKFERLNKQIGLPTVVDHFPPNKTNCPKRNSFFEPRTPLCWAWLLGGISDMTTITSLQYLMKKNRSGETKASSFAHYGSYRVMLVAYISQANFQSLSVHVVDFWGNKGRDFCESKNTKDFHINDHSHIYSTSWVVCFTWLELTTECPIARNLSRA